MSLPIFDLREPFWSTISENTPTRIVLEAPTGSGKSTQIPQFLLDAPSGSAETKGTIIVLQPRRLAARMLARRVASERRCPLGDEVGYHVRLDRKASQQTRILYITEGILLRMMLGNPELSGIGAVILDEFHERHLDGDIALATLLEIQDTLRPDLKLIVMSATLDSERLEAHLAPCQKLVSEGRTFPVTTSHRAPKQRPGRSGRPETEPAWEQAAAACSAIAPDYSGDILIFMPGAYEIRRTIKELENSRAGRRFTILPLYGELSPAEQDRATAPPSNGQKPRIIVSTNVAETSLTLPGVTMVIDSGLARIASFDQRRGINTLTIQPISRASADQRAGRAGRVSAGTCVRLWSESNHSRREGQTPPEIHRVDLSECFLFLMAARTGKPEELAWLDPPSPEATTRAHSLLNSLGATDSENTSLSIIGKQMAKFPLHPRLSRMLIAAEELNHVPLAALCAALSSSRGIFLGGKGASDWQDEYTEKADTSDFHPLIRAFLAARESKFRPSSCSQLGVNANAAREINTQWERLLGTLGQSAPDSSKAREMEDATPRELATILLSAFSDQVGCRTDSGSITCNLVGGRRGQLRKNTVPRGHRLVVATELAEVEGKDFQVYLSGVTGIEPEWLEALYPSEFTTGQDHRFDELQRRVVCAHSTKFRDLVLESKEKGTPAPDAAAQILAGLVEDNTLNLKRWDAKVEEWIARVNCLADWAPELEITPIRDSDRRDLLAQICYGAASYREIKNLDPWNILHEWLSPMQRAAMADMAPERIILVSGQGTRVFYKEGEPPRIAATIQHLYDQNENPKICNDRIPVTVELLAPNRRPAAVSSDLPFFWKETYPNVKKELKGRYPKHEWR